MTLITFFTVCTQKIKKNFMCTFMYVCFLPTLRSSIRHRKYDKSKEKYEIYEFMGGGNNLWVMAVKIVVLFLSNACSGVRVNWLNFSGLIVTKRVVQEFINK